MKQLRLFTKIKKGGLDKNDKTDIIKTVNLTAFLSVQNGNDGGF